MWLILDNPWVCLIFMITMYTMKVIILIFTYMEYLISTNSKFNALRDGDAGNSNIMTFILYKTFIQVSKTQIISYFFTFWVYASKGTGVGPQQQCRFHSGRYCRDFRVRSRQMLTTRSPHLAWISRHLGRNFRQPRSRSTAVPVARLVECKAYWRLQAPDRCSRTEIRPG